MDHNNSLKLLSFKISSYLTDFPRKGNGEKNPTVEAHLRVCIEDFDPLGGDEQIHLGEGLRFSVATLLQGKNTKTT